MVVVKSRSELQGGRPCLWEAVLRFEKRFDNLFDLKAISAPTAPGGPSLRGDSLLEKGQAATRPWFSQSPRGSIHS